MRYYSKSIWLVWLVMLCLFTQVNGQNPTQPSPPLYKLPFSPSDTEKCSQSNESNNPQPPPSHINDWSHYNNGKEAFDFVMSDGETIYATRAGVVVNVAHHHQDGNCSSISCSRNVNRVVIDHGDNTYGLYMHLKENGVSVTKNQYVRQGQAIGLIGNSGWSSASHLHYQVEALPNNAVWKTNTSHWQESIPTCFYEVETNNGVPEYSHYYNSHPFSAFLINDRIDIIGGYNTKANTVTVKCKPDEYAYASNNFDVLQLPTSLSDAQISNYIKTFKIGGITAGLNFSNWQRDTDGFSFDVVIPANTFSSTTAGLNIEFDVEYFYGGSTTSWHAYGHKQVYLINDFSDVPQGHVFKDYIDKCVVSGIMEETDGTFNPETNITRGEMAVWVFNAAHQLGLIDVDLSGARFNDIDICHPLFKEIQSLRNAGVISANPDFNPDWDVTRGELSKIIVNGLSLPTITNPTITKSDISTNIFKTHIETLLNTVKGYQSETCWLFLKCDMPEYILSGYPDETFKPLGKTTKGEAAKFVFNSFMAKQLQTNPSPMPNGSPQAIVSGSSNNNFIRIGTNFEQLGSSLGNAPSNLSLSGGNNITILDNQTLTLSHPSLTDTDGDVLYFYWAFENGTVSSNDAVHSSITFTPPSVNQATDIIFFTVSGDNNGNISSGQFTITVEPSTPPSTPQNAVATPISSSQVRIEFDEIESANFYTIERALISNQSNFTLVTTLLGSDNTDYQDNNLTGNTTYVYRITAYNSSGASNYVLVPVTTIANPSDLIVTTANTNPSQFPITDLNGLYTSFTLKNQGNGDANTFDVSFYLSSDQSLDGSDLLLSEVKTIYSGINAGSQVNTFRNINLPANVTHGQYYVIVKADGNDEILESDETNNELAIPITIQVADFVAQSYTPISTNINTGDYFNSNFIYQNIGNALVSNITYRYEVWLSTDNQVDPLVDTRLRYGTHNYTTVGETRTQNINALHIDHTFAGGNYYLIAVVDPTNVIPELDDVSNNIIATPITLNNPSQSPPTQVINVQTSSLSSSSITLSFDAIPFANEYVVMQSLDQTNYTYLDTIIGTSLQLNDFSPQQQVCFKIYAINNYGDGTESSVSCATTYPIVSNIYLVSLKDGYSVNLNTGYSATFSASVNNETNYTNEGNSYVRGHWTSGPNADVSGNGEVIFDGAGQQELEGAFNIIKVQNTSNLKLTDVVSVETKLEFVNGAIDLNSFDLTIENSGSIVGYDAQKYIHTNGGGELRQYINSMGSIDFPIGQSIYNPLTITNNSVGSTIGAIAIDTSSYGSSTTGKVNRTWLINDGVLGSSLDIDLQWNETDELPNYNRLKTVVATWDNYQNDWVELTSPVNPLGTNVYQVTANQVPDSITVLVVKESSLPDKEAVYSSYSGLMSNLSQGDTLANVTDADGDIVYAFLTNGNLPIGTYLDTLKGYIIIQDINLLAAGTYIFDITTRDTLGEYTTQSVSIILTDFIAVPTNLSITTLNAQQLLLNWSDNATNELGYEIFGSSDGVIFSTIGNISHNTTSYIIDNLQAGERYYAKVRAIGLNTYSAYSNTANGLTCPIASLSVNELSICSGDTSVISLSVSPNTNIQWLENGNPIAFLGNSYSTTGAATYQVIASNSSCTDSSNTITISNGSVPNIFQITGDTLISANSDTLTYSVDSLSNITYNWLVPNDAIILSGQGTHEIVVDFGDSSGIVQVLATSNTGCSSELEIPIYIQHTVTQILYLNAGWNWISFFVEADNMDINAILSGLNSPTSNDYVKSHTGFATYIPSVGWWGLGNLETGKLYKVFISQADTISITGQLVDTTNIALQAGWNWIGFNNTDTKSIDTLTQSLAISQNDACKTQTGFAIYDSVIHWYGSMSSVAAGEGVKLFLNQADTLTIYQLAKLVNQNTIFNTGSQVVAKNNQLWSYNPRLHSNNITMTGKVSKDNELFKDTDAVIGAFVNGECRGTALLEYQQDLNEYVFYLTVHGKANDLIEFKVLDENGRILPALEQVTFIEDDNLGNIQVPFVLNIIEKTVSTSNIELKHSKIVKIFPNPTSKRDSYVNIHYHLDADEKIGIALIDPLGRRRIIQSVTKQQAGEHIFQWTPFELQSGLYLLQLIKNDKPIDTHKLIIKE